MRIGLFADAHDHVDNVCRAVAEFNRLECELVIFAGDFVSPIVVPPLRKLKCPVLACFGDNDGNQIGLQGGMRIVGPVGYPPFGFRAADGVRILVAHISEQVRGMIADAQVVNLRPYPQTGDSHRSKRSALRQSGRDERLDLSQADDWCSGNRAPLGPDHPAARDGPVPANMKAALTPARVVLSYCCPGLDPGMILKQRK